MAKLSERRNGSASYSRRASWRLLLELYLGQWAPPAMQRLGRSTSGSNFAAAPSPPRRGRRLKLCDCSLSNMAMRASSPSMMLMPGSANRAGYRKGSAPSKNGGLRRKSGGHEVCAGHDAQFVARALAERGMLGNSPKAYSAKFASVPRLCALTS